MTHYKVVNTSKKPGVKKGHHVHGFYVALGDNVPFWAGESHIVTEITPAMLTMQRKGFISIEPVKDIDDIIKKQIRENEVIRTKAEEKRVKDILKEKESDLEVVKEELNRPVEKKDYSNLSTGLNKKDMKEKARTSKGKVSAAKVDGPGVDPLGELEESMNPDGEPNFVVKAKRNKRR